MVGRHTLLTPRLRLRPLGAEDATAVAEQAGRREIAHTTISVPHPCPVSEARGWIHRMTADTKAVVFAIVEAASGRLVGTIGLRDIDTEHSLAEMGFWVGVESWGKGYATEAASAVLEFAFEHLRLNRVYAHHMQRNPASGRVLAKVGMQREGLERERVCKWGVFEDVVLMAILRRDWQAAHPPGPSV